MGEKNKMIGNALIGIVVGIVIVAIYFAVRASFNRNKQPAPELKLVEQENNN